MAQFFIKNGSYFETITDLPPAQWPVGAAVVSQRPSPDHEFINGVWTYVQPVLVLTVPQTISKLQAKLAAGPATVAAIDAFMNDPAAPWAMKTAWSDAVELNRTSQMVDELAWVLGWNSSALDLFFTQAAQIKV